MESIMRMGANVHERIVQATTNCSIDNNPQCLWEHFKNDINKLAYWQAKASMA